MSTMLINQLLLPFLLGLYLYLNSTKFCCCNKDHYVGCVERERKALLDFKQSLTDPSGRLSSWVGLDCCLWEGVVCNNITGHVIKLHMRNPCGFSFSDRFNMDEAALSVCDKTSLGGEVSPSLLELKYLSHLDLSLNNFNGIDIPSHIGSLQKLIYLNLSCASFGGTVPPHLGNLSNLHQLDLSVYSFSNWNPELKVDSLKWLSNLTSLRYLNMRFVNLSVATDWLHFVSMLPSLSELHLSDCQLYELPSTLPNINLASLAILDLSANYFNASIPLWLFNITSLTKFDLSDNNLQDPIPDAFTNMTSLQEVDLSGNGNIGGKIPRTLGDLCKLQRLDLSWNNISDDIADFFNGLSSCTKKSLVSINLQENQLSGNLPASIGSLSSLKELFLNDNQMNGVIPETIGQLSELVVLSLSENSWEGVLSEIHFSNLTKLEELWILTSSNSLALNVEPDWVPPFSLKIIDLSHCQMGPAIPPWLRFQKNLYNLFISNVGISDTVSDWFWRTVSGVNYIDISKNQITGRIPDWVRFPYASGVDLSYNHFEGPIPVWSSRSLVTLILRNNSFSGSIPEEIGKMMPNLGYLDLSWNSLNGNIPFSMRNMKNLGGLVLSNNGISGELPQFWKDLEDLWYLDLADNNLSGEIPSSLGFLSSLLSLRLSNNGLFGELPSSLQDCTNLFTIDIGENRITGKLPTWIGESLSSLLILRLRSNLFVGNIPEQLCNFSSLHIIDLGNNNLSGFIPPCLGYLHAFSVLTNDIPPGFVPWYNELIAVVSKGQQLEYSTTRSLVKIIDISNNNLSGRIPNEMTNLLGLGTLNLSMNHLTGKIPNRIGRLQSLETLDLSRNQLDGSIPPGISALTFLSHLNLSYNNLSGLIPSGDQLQTLNDPSIYIGNSELCGPPLTTNCSSTTSVPGQGGDDINATADDEEAMDILSFGISIAVGFIVGFWTFCGVLICKRSWRYAYFGFIDDTIDNLRLIANSVLCRK